MKILIYALDKIKSIGKNKKSFLIQLIQGLIGATDKRTFRNMSRYTEIEEHTFSRQMTKDVDFPAINAEMIAAAKDQKEPFMISRMSHISIFVPNQQEALLFYTEKLGFKVHTDATFGTSRWLTLTAPGAPDFEISLMEGIPLNTHGVPAAVFITDDFYVTYNDLVAKGVTFITEPQEEPWGVGATFTGIAGNIFYLNQPTSLAVMSKPKVSDPRIPL